MINVAIDGPAGAGKSTIAKAVAKRFGYVYLDTGAMYRATAYFALKNGVDIADENAVSRVLDKIEMEIKYDEKGVQQIFVCGENTTPYLREHHMSKAASDISAWPAVRYKMADLQRTIAKSNNVVLDGREIGTFVLPNANYKFFMTASSYERARRRFIELEQKGEKVDLEILEADIIERDYNDSHRKVAPLKQAEDAIFIDTTKMSISEVVDLVERKIKGDNMEENSTAVQNVTQDEIVKTPLKPKKALTFRLYRFLRIVLRPIISMLFPTKIINKENFYKIEGGVIICNHYSIMDTIIPVMKLFKKELHVMAKAEAFEKNIGRKFLRAIGAIPVHRGESDIAAVREVMSVLRANKKFLIFPEGTRNREGTEVMSELKQGASRFAIKSKKPILPMMYYRMHKLFRRNYLYIGEPIYMDEFFTAKTPDDYKKAIDLVQEKMNEVRVLLDAHVDGLKSK